MVGSDARRLAVAIHGEDPWTGLEAPPTAPDLQGWGSDDPFFGTLVERVRPRAYLEVGTWKGASVVTVCDHADRLGLDTTAVCVDTWLGSREMIGVESGHENRGLRRWHGHPRVYETFARNVAARGHAGRVVPFPSTSRIALRWLAEAGERFDLAYVDGSHDYQDVLDDALGAWGLLRGPGSVLFGDDHDSTHWPGVVEAVRKFGWVARVEVELRGRFWVATRA